MKNVWKYLETFENIHYDQIAIKKFVGMLCMFYKQAAQYKMS